MSENIVKNYSKIMLNIAVSILNKSNIDALFNGDSYDKIIRNLSTRDKEGILIYNCDAAFNHFPRSKTANDIVLFCESWNEMVKLSTNKNKTRIETMQLYLEHDIPISVTKLKLRSEIEKKPIDRIKIKKIIENGIKITLITKNESNKINKEYKSKMPDYPLTRYSILEIDIITSEEYNRNTELIKSVKSDFFKNALLDAR